MTDHPKAPFNPEDPASFGLPGNINSLAEMRDQLAHYLGILEQNTDAITAWISDNRNDIIVSLHQLVRSVALQKDEQAALALLDKTDKSILYFILSLEDFEALGKTHFGADSAFAAAAASLPKGFDPALTAALPDLNLPNNMAELSRPKETLPPPPPPEKSNILASWFKSSSQRAVEEAVRDAETLLARWKTLHRDLVGLHSDRHYYVDSFMDWIGENLAPSDPAQDFEALMKSYQHPAYVIDLAQKDYAAAIGVRADSLRDAARDYSKLAGLLDRQDIAGFIAALPSLFPETPTAESENNKKLLLQDFGAASFCDLALRCVKDRGDQLALLEATVALEGKPGLMGVSHGAARVSSEEEKIVFVFSTLLLEHVLAEKDPLSSKALAIAMRTLCAHDESRTILASSCSTVPRLMERFDGDIERQKEALDDLFDGFDSNIPDLHERVIDFAQACRAKDVHAAGRILDATAAQDLGASFTALWRLCYPGRSILGDVIACAQDDVEGKNHLAATISRSFRAGVMDELRGKPGALKAFIEDRILPRLDRYPLQDLSYLLACADAGTGDARALLRPAMTKDGGWLEQIAHSGLPARSRQNYIAALLSPFNSDVVSANILAEAAQNASAPAMKQAFTAMEENLVGRALRLDDTRVFFNLHRVANIWYNTEYKTLCYTTDGITQTLAEGMSPEMARETLALLERRGDFMPENSGLFNPANVDRIELSEQELAMYWHKCRGDLNAAPGTMDILRQRGDFLHETRAANGDARSFNINSVALLERQEDGEWLLVDKNGAAFLLAGVEPFAAEDAFVKLGDGAYLNPANAALLSLEAEKQSVLLRLESPNFDAFLKSIGEEGHFYRVAAKDADAVPALARRLDAGKAFVSPGGAMSQLYFNMPVLGYLMHVEERGDFAFRCRRSGDARKPGTIYIDGDTMKEIMSGLSASDKVHRIGDTFLQPESVDNVYYNYQKNVLYVLCGSDGLEMSCAPAAAEAFIKVLPQYESFEAVSYQDDGTWWNLFSPREAADVVRIGKATMLEHDAAEDVTHVTVGSEKIPVKLSARKTADLADLIEAKGLDDLDALAPQNPHPLADKLRDVVAGLPAVSAPRRPVLGDLDANMLLLTAIEGGSGAQKEIKANAKSVTQPARKGASRKSSDRYVEKLNSRGFGKRR